MSAIDEFVEYFTSVHTSGYDSHPGMIERAEDIARIALTAQIFIRA